MSKVTFLFYLLLPLPVMLANVPLSNILFVAYAVYISSLHFTRRKIKTETGLLFLSLILILFLFLRSSSLEGLDSFLALSRYVSALLPLFMMSSLIKNLSAMTENRLTLLIKASLTALLMQTILGHLMQCRTAYGGTCVLIQKSSSFGAAASVLIFCMSILLAFSRDICLRYLAILSSVFFLVVGAQQGSRLFWVLLIVALLGILWQRLTRYPPRIRLSFSVKPLNLLILFFVSLVLLYSSTVLPKLTSIMSLTRFSDLMQDSRLSSGIIFRSRLDTDPSGITSTLFGHSLFSQMTSWNATSSYDSTINMLMSDFGLLGTSLLLFFLITAFTFQFKTLKALGRSHTPLTLGIALYLVGSITNEFILLKSFNPLFAFLVALVSSYIPRASSGVPPKRWTVIRGPSL